MTDALEPERWMQREASLLPFSGALGPAKMNFPKAPPSPWPSGISHLYSFHWVDTDPWLWAEGGNRLIMLSSGRVHSLLPLLDTASSQQEGKCRDCFYCFFNCSWGSNREEPLPREELLGLDIERE